MNAKIRKVLSDMTKIEDKIKELQAKWQELNKQKIELENLEIIGLIRGANIDINNLPQALTAYRNKSGVPFSFQKQEGNQNEEN